MQMICNKAKECPQRDTCRHAKPFDPVGLKGCTEFGVVKEVPARTKRKAVTLWVVYKDHPRMAADENHGEAYYTRNIARQVADELRADGCKVRGPVKVAL